MEAGLSTKPALSAETRRGILAWIAKAIFGMGFFALLLLPQVPAGRWDWVWGWVFLGLFALATVANVLILLRVNPELLASRSRGLHEPGAKRWDKIVTSIGVGILPLAGWVVAALDLRFGWTAGMPLWLHLTGVAGFILGWIVVLWATAANRFFSTTVQLHQGQTVQTGGPYRYVRHPGYAGALIYQFATVFVLGSWLAMIPMVAAVPFLVLRTAREDRMLQTQLAGYRDYASQVRYRLLPRVW